MDYKQTLNLPKTDFPMRANLAVREPELLKRWQSEDLYRRLLEKNAQGKRFVLHDGPPYANGNVHLGTALNKIVKDIIVKRHLMAGEYAPYIPGWDCHGMPIEHQVLRELGDQARQLPRLEIRRRCRDFAEKYYKIQREQFQRLGVLGDWDNPYLTMSTAYEAGIIRVFRELVEGGYIYRGLRPVHWCPSCATALAEAEVEYSDHESPSIYVRFAFRGSAAQAASMAADSGDGAWLAQRAAAISAVIWTTTPWTLPANLAVCLNPHLEYVALEVGPDVFLVAARRADEFLAAIGAEAVRRVAVNLIGLDGEDLFRHPFIDRPSRLIFESHVTADVGTGCVHTAPGHGYEDFQVGQKYGLDGADSGGRRRPLHRARAANTPAARCSRPTAPSSRSCASAAPWSRARCWRTPYPHCWRCKSPLIFRATEQWFLRVDHAELAPARAARDRGGALGAAVGTGSHPQHDGDASRLVPVAPARLGCAHPGVLVRSVRPLPRRRRDHRPRRGGVRRTWLRRLVRVGAAGAAARGVSLRVRLGQPDAGRQHPRRLVRRRLLAPRGPRGARPRRGPPTSTSRRSISTAAGSRCR